MEEQFLSEFYGPPGADVIDYYVFSLDYKKKKKCAFFYKRFPLATIRSQMVSP